MTAQGKAALLELRDRLAKATGPDRKADALLARLVGGWVFDGREAIYPWRAPDAVYHMAAPVYTASLDAAVTLVPENISYELAFSAAGEGAIRRARFWDWRRGPLMIDPDNSWQGVGKTLPLAICVARIEYELAKEGQP